MPRRASPAAAAVRPPEPSPLWAGCAARPQTSRGRSMPGLPGSVAPGGAPSTNAAYCSVDSRGRRCRKATTSHSSSSLSRNSQAGMPLIWMPLRVTQYSSRACQRWSSVDQRTRHRLHALADVVLRHAGRAVALHALVAKAGRALQHMRRRRRSPAAARCAGAQPHRLAHRGLEQRIDRLHVLRGGRHVVEPAVHHGGAAGAASNPRAAMVASTVVQAAPTSAHGSCGLAALSDASAVVVSAQCRIRRARIGRCRRPSPPSCHARPPGVSRCPACGAARPAAPRSPSCGSEPRAVRRRTAARVERGRRAAGAVPVRQLPRHPGVAAARGRRRPTAGGLRPAQLHRRPCAEPARRAGALDRRARRAGAGHHDARRWASRADDARDMAAYLL